MESLQQIWTFIIISPSFFHGNKARKWLPGDFPGGPVVKTLLSNAGGAGSIPGWGAKTPHAKG